MSRKINPPKEVDTIYLVVEPKHLALSTRSKFLNSFSINTGTIAKNHGGNQL